MTSTQKVAIVTGAGSGIGKASALALMTEGYAVVFAGRRKDMLESAAAEGKGTAGKSLVVQTDVGNHESIKALFATTKQTFGRLDVLFNNAGGGAPPVLLEDLTYEQWQTVVNANLTGVFLCTQEAFKIMKAQTPMGGRIINNGSISAHAPRPNSAPYTATKHGVTGLTKVTALDGRKYDIACGQIDIGNAATPMTERMARGVPQANGTTAVEPTMNVKAVADAVVYMASLPLDANVLFLTVMATKMPFVGRGAYSRAGGADGLPVVPPSDASIAATLAAAGLQGHEILGEVPGRNTEVIAEKAAINAVMAGCRPEYMPVVVAAVRSLCDPAFAYHGPASSTGGSAMALVVNGPIAKRLGINSGNNLLGQGHRPNATIGRAVRLIMMNTMNTRPGFLDRATLGNPGKYSFCFAEHEEDHPWEPLHVSRGLGRHESAATMIGPNSLYQVYNQLAATPEPLLLCFADALCNMGSPNLKG